MSDKDIEQEIQVKGKTAPRVTPDDIESVIADEKYFTAADGVAGRHQYLIDTRTEDEKVSKMDINKSLSLLTFCVLVLKNGFTVTRESACASSDNFDAEIGRRIARANAVEKIWMLEGYLLKQKLSEA